MTEIKYRQYVIVPKNPKMSTGKVASQVAHATYMALEEEPDKKNIECWKNSGMCVIVLECKNSVDLYGIATYFEQWDIPYHLYIDEGLTEVPPLSPTALATGILTDDQFWMLQKFKLFKG